MQKSFICVFILLFLYVGYELLIFTPSPSVDEMKHMVEVIEDDYFNQNNQDIHVSINAEYIYTDLAQWGPLIIASGVATQSEVNKRLKIASKWVAVWQLKVIAGVHMFSAVSPYSVGKWLDKATLHGNTTQEIFYDSNIDASKLYQFMLLEGNNFGVKRDKNNAWWNAYLNMQDYARKNISNQ